MLHARPGHLAACFLSLAIAVCACPGEARAQDEHVRAHPPGSDADLAQQLQNPIASLISVPFQNNLDFGGGPGNDGFGNTLNIQPVVPLRLNDDWTVISRSIIPIIHQERYSAEHETGLGDITQSFFFSRRSDVPGLTLGVGPAVLLPTATRPAFQSRQWGAGPTAVVVQQSGSWTMGVLANHLWGFADSADRRGRPDLNQTFMQPFVSHNFSNGFAATATLEASYDWTGRQWTLPLAAGVSQLVNIGQTPVNLVAQARYWFDGPSNAPEWGLRFAAVFVFR
ncbi:transporter [Roseomonas aerophila]|uniref:Transporter n=2 Tax=Teichococcus aerophilus TaxID=1224513 RepID=A0ABR7RMD5_9PROT|nr:transporter [Pseudoroseomonas aerophila]